MKWQQLKFFQKKLYLPIFERIKNDDFVPAKRNIFRAFILTSFESTRVVILGQDPYPTKGDAVGLAFSTGVHRRTLPRSLSNIFREYRDDTGYDQPRNGDLTVWANNDVLLLNTSLTTKAGEPMAHRGIGWEKLTHEVIRKLSEHRDHVVFMLWGKQAQEYRGAIDEDKHLVITAPHPSPFSARKGFFGHRPFTKANKFFEMVQQPPIDWRLP